MACHVGERAGSFFKSLSGVRLFIWLVTVASIGTSAYKCPENRQCYCEDTVREYNVHCTSGNSSSFDITYEPSTDILKIECGNRPNWREFQYDLEIESKRIKKLLVVACTLPEKPEDNLRISRLLGTAGIEELYYRYLGGPLASHDLAPYPDLVVLNLSDNEMRNVSKDLLRGVPKLRVLNLRGTKILVGPGFFADSGALEKLELGYNDLEDIEPGTFDGLNSINLLNLWRNNLTHLRSGTFRNLKTLERLDISNNHLGTLTYDLFNDLENLQVIKLNRNNFSSFSYGVFQNNKNLREIIMSYNPQNITQLPSKMFANLPLLENITLTAHKLQSLPEDLFWDSTNIRKLLMDRNLLESLPVKLFKDLNKLTTLDLFFNELKELPEEIFESTRNLKTLILSKNHITTIKENTFKGLWSLEVLNMEHNDLTYIHPHAFIHLENLKIAKFSYNKLTLQTGLIEPTFGGLISPFHHCIFLEELYLAHNNISEMHSDWVINLMKLKVLDLKYNMFDHLEAEDLQFTVSKGIDVDLRYNFISRLLLARLESMSLNQNTPRDVIINVENNPIRCDCEVYEFLRYLNGDMHPYVQNYVHIKVGDLVCADNPQVKLTNLKSETLKCREESELSRPGDPCAQDGQCECWFRPHDKALLLDCVNRNLYRAPEWIETKRATKVELYLQENNLIETPAMNKPGYEKVEKLDLSNNKIRYIDDRLALATNLKVLKLNGNNLTHVDSRILQKWSNSTRLATLTLHDNPWKCDCEAGDFLHFIQSTATQIPELTDVRCNSNKIALSKLIFEEICPSSSRLVILLASAISTMCLLIGFFVALFYRFQTEIKIWLYSKNMCLCWVTEEELDRDKVYDAFISYSHKDEEFVVKELVSRLEEGPNPYKICIHIRDWLAGEWIPTQIARSVEESRRTVIVLSKSFLDSVWGRMEFQAAHKQAITEKRARVIVILYGDIGPIEKLPNELQAYLKMNTYIEWGDPWFWRKLRFALPHSKRGPKGVKVNDDHLMSLSQVIAEKKAAETKISIIDEKQFSKISMIDEKQLPDAFIETVKELKQTFNVKFDIRTPQCTTV